MDGGRVGTSFFADLGAFLAWRRRGFSGHAPWRVKHAVLLRHGVEGAQWVETGTFRGATAAFLACHAPRVFTIEPDPAHYRRAARRFRETNVEVIRGTSEEVLPGVLARLSGDVNFWLDGHYSGGSTFHGPRACPVEAELAAISARLDRLGQVSIMIDDVRCFLPPDRPDPSYPPLDALVDWARAAGFDWRIEHDILAMTNWRRGSGKPGDERPADATAGLRLAPTVRAGQTAAAPGQRSSR